MQDGILESFINDPPSPGALAPSKTIRKAYWPEGRELLHYREIRPTTPFRKRALICVHAAQLSGRCFEPLMGLMGGNRPMLAPDLPGYGDSDAPAEAPGVEEYAKAITDLADALGIATFDLLGDRLGSAVAVEIARRHPDRAHRLVLVSAFASIRAEHTMAPQPAADGGHLARHWEDWVMHSQHEQHPVSQFGDILRRPTVAHWGHIALARYALAERLAELNHPVAIVHPNDRSGEAARRVASVAANATVYEFSYPPPNPFEARAYDLAPMIRKHLDEAGP